MPKIEKKYASEWYDRDKYKIILWSGFDRNNFYIDWFETPITEKQFLKKLAKCTILKDSKIIRPK